MPMMRNEGRKGFTYPNPILLEKVSTAINTGMDVSNQTLFFCLKAGPNPRLVLFWRGGNWKPTFSYVTNLLEVIQDPSQVSKKRKGKSGFLG